MTFININLLGSVKAPVIYDDKMHIISGDKRNRIELALENNGLKIPIAMIGRQIFDKFPKPTLIDKFLTFFGRKYLVLKVNTGKNEGFVKVNRKKLL